VKIEQRNMRKVGFYILLNFFLIGFSFGQQLSQTIKGRVVDQQSKSPVIGASVVLVNSNPIQGSTTDLDGYFKIVNVPIGRQTFVVSSVGYESKTIASVTVTSGKEVVIEVELAESLTQMDEVVVVAYSEGQPENEMATVSAISLSVEETSRTAATFGDPARAALSQPGVTTGGDDLLNEIVIRGNSPKGILWRLEGVEIPNPNHFAAVGSSAGGISMLSSSVLSNSDFFTAAFPAQYGNATSGIFDLKLRNGNFEKREHSFQAGLLGIEASSEGPLSSKSNASYLFNYRYSTLGLFSALGINVLGDEENVNFQDLSFKLNLPTKKLGKFSVWGLGGHNTYASKFENFKDFKHDSVYAAYYVPKYGAGQKGDSVHYFLGTENIVQHMGVLGVTHTAYLGKDTYIESVASIMSQRFKYEYDSAQLRVLEIEDIAEQSFRFSTLLNHKFNAKNTLRLGLIGSRKSFDLKNSDWQSGDKVYFDVLDKSGSTYFYQGFGQLQHRVNQDLTLNGGFHASYFALNNQLYLEPRLGFRWQANPQSAFTGGIGMHSRMETISLYMAQDSAGVQNNRNLGFTRAIHNVLGYEHSFGKGLRWKVEGYYQYLYDVPVWPSDTISYQEALTFSAINSYDDYTNQKLANAGTGRNYGLEMTINKSFVSNYFFMLNGSLYQSKYKGVDGVERNTVFNGNYIFNALGGREFKFADGRKLLNLNARFIYAGGKREAPILLAESKEMGYTVRDYSKNYEVKLDDYMRVDIGISYKVNKVKSASVFSINVQNVFAIENEYGRYYSRQFDNIQTEVQLGFFPNLSYRIEF
jgi:hypothetical protein